MPQVGSFHTITGDNFSRLTCPTFLGSNLENTTGKNASMPSVIYKEMKQERGKKKDERRKKKEERRKNKTSSILFTRPLCSDPRSIPLLRYVSEKISCDLRNLHLLHFLL
jgi:hypothetical protein